MGSVSEQETGIERVPPPWTLRGSGWVIFYNFDREFMQQPNTRRPEFKGLWRGGLGAVAVLDYRESGVGPYSELLFVPGRFAEGRKRHHSIATIFVSSQASVVNGQANWGIPKQLADVQIVTDDDGLTQISAAQTGYTFFELKAREGHISLPVNTRLCPITLMQKWEGRTFFTRLSLRAGVRWLTIESIWANNAYFPDPSRARPLGAVRLDDFQITFPIPEVKSAAPEAGA